MKKQNKSLTTVTIGVILLVFAGAFAYAFARAGGDKSDASINNNPITEWPAGAETAPPNPTPETSKDKSTAATTPGKYIAFSEEALHKSEGRRILFFHAQWCPQCRSLEADIKKQGVPNGMTILQVNYDSATTLRQKYGVTLQTTFVEIDSSGKLLKKHVAYNEPRLDAVLDVLGR